MNGWQQKSKLWTSEDEQRLKALALAGKSAAEIAADLGRTENAVARRAYQFGFSLRHTRRLASTLSNEAIAKCLDDKWRTVAQIRSRLGVKTTAGWLAEALQHMAKAGVIERRCEQTSAPKRMGVAFMGNLSIESFRRRRPDTL